MTNAIDWLAVTLLHYRLHKTVIWLFWVLPRDDSFKGLSKLMTTSKMRIFETIHIFLNLLQNVIICIDLINYMVSPQDLFKEVFFEFIIWHSSKDPLTQLLLTFKVIFSFNNIVIIYFIKKLLAFQRFNFF